MSVNLFGFFFLFVDSGIIPWFKIPHKQKVMQEWRICMDRITNHPILGESPEGKTVQFTYDGKMLSGIEGEPIAAALRAADVMVHRYTNKKHEPRGVFCAIGRCTDCVMIVDGKPNIRTCITPLKEGMVVETQYGAAGKEEAGW